jgi:hypothetical protein
MSPDVEIDTLARTLVTVLGVFILVMSAVLIYVFWLWLELHREVRQRLPRPQVDRDHLGRRIKERR